jgi:DNA-directed RNA polymerase alpha subunit
MIIDDLLRDMLNQIEINIALIGSGQVSIDQLHNINSQLNKFADAVTQLLWEKTDSYKFLSNMAEDLDVSTRLRNKFRRNNLTILDLVLMSEIEFMLIWEKGIGYKSLNEVKHALELRGLRLGMQGIVDFNVVPYRLQVRP